MSTIFDSRFSDDPATLEVEAASWLASAVSFFFFLSDLLLRGCDNLDPSRYKAQAFNPNCQLSMYASAISSIVASLGRLMVLEMAPLMKGCTAPIIRIWPCA